MNGLFVLLPVILSIGIVSAIPFSDAKEYDQICIDKVWIENTKGKIACVTPSTADVLVERGWGTMLDDSALLEPVACTLDYNPVCGVDGKTYGNMCALNAVNTELAYKGECNYTGQYGIDYEAELSLVPQVDGGKTALTVTPVIGTPDREYSDVYVAGTEELAENEMRLTFCGTGMPFPVYQQAAACLLVELGNGDILIFDLGTTSASRINGMGIDGNKLNKIFIGHLHTDHIGDLAIFWSQGGFSGRTVPLEVYGPTGPDHSTGTAYYVEKTLEANKWDLESRKTGIPTEGMAINVHEFDWEKTQVIYEENGVTITSFPAIHALDGAVSFRLDWNDLSMVFSSDTKPNKFLVENSQEVDVLIHEGFAPAQTLSDVMGMPIETATFISEEAHTPPNAAGVVYDMTQPRLAVLYHVILTQDIVSESFESLRTSYAGPALYAEDLVTINVTPDYIISRPTEIVKNIYPDYKATEGVVEGSEYGLSDWLVDSKIDWKSYIEEKTQ